MQAGKYGRYVSIQNVRTVVKMMLNVIPRMEMLTKTKRIAKMKTKVMAKMETKTKTRER